MKKNFFVIITCLIFVVACITIFMLRDKKVVIKFDSDGGVVVESIEIKKGETINLPNTTKEGFIFNGWYLDNTKVSNETKYDKDTTLKANWLKENAKTFTITFDSNGGSKVESITLECGEELVLPNNPTKEGYKFLSWIDKNNVTVNDNALLACENTSLKANWEKAETNKEKAKDTTTTKETKEQTKIYTCPSGYTLSGTKCILEETVKEKCGERGYAYEGKCVTLKYDLRKDTQKTCPKEMVTYMSFAGKVDGKVVNWGVVGCAYYKTNDTVKENCESHGFKWVTPESTCYVKWISNNTINTCDYLNGYTYITNPNSYDGVNGLNGGCYPVSDKVKYCDEGYTLNNGKCIKTINATLK